MSINVEEFIQLTSKKHALNEKDLSDFILGLSKYIKEAVESSGSVFNLWEVKAQGKCDYVTTTRGTTAISHLSTQVKKNNGKVPSAAFDNFYRSLVRPPVITNMMKSIILTTDNQNLKKSGEISKHSKAFFLSLVTLVLENDEIIHIEGIGTFQTNSDQFRIFQYQY